MSNPMEGMNMNSERNPIDAALERATASRKAFLQEHPDFLRGDEFDAATPPPAGVPAETPRQAHKKILPGAAAHDLHQRKLLGKDF